MEKDQRIAELVEDTARLQDDLAASQRVVDAALAAQASAASEAGSNEGMRMEMATLQNQMRSYEEQLSDERASAAKEFAALTFQLQRSRETAKSLSDANRALLATREVDEENTGSQLAGFEAQMVILTDENSSLRAENQALQTALTEANSAPKPPADWQQTQAALTRQIETLNRDLRTAESYATTVTDLTGANEQLQVSVAELEVRLGDAANREQQAKLRETSLRGDLETERTAKESLASQLAAIADLPNQVSEMGSTLADARAENQALQTALTEARAAPKPCLLYTSPSPRDRG